jgi:hypothetical protein
VDEKKTQAVPSFSGQRQLAIFCPQSKNLEIQKSMIRIRPLRSRLPPPSMEVEFVVKFSLLLHHPVSQSRNNNDFFPEFDLFYRNYGGLQFR